MFRPKLLSAVKDVGKRPRLSLDCNGMRVCETLMDVCSETGHYVALGVVYSWLLCGQCGSHSIDEEAAVRRCAPVEDRYSPRYTLCVWISNNPAMKYNTAC